MSDTRIVIFAKAPLPGFAKTRLIPVLGESGSAQLAVKMLTHTVRQAIEAQVGPVEVCVSPSLDHPIWSSLSLPSQVIWSEQGEGDLGRRLSRVSKRLLEENQNILLIGTDCPALDAENLRAAARSLLRHEVCITPVSDGGYALLGLRLFHESLFERIPWSTGAVFKITEHRIQALGWCYECLEKQHDIDVPDDLRWLPEAWQTFDVAD